jgi:hypothetical protein
MTIIERPGIEEFQRFFCKGGSIQFVISASDVDPDGNILAHLSLQTLAGGFQIPREFDEPLTHRSLAEAMAGDAWREFEKLIAGRGGTINYRLVSPGLYRAACLIALGKIGDYGDPAPGQDGAAHFSASLQQ